MSNSVIIKSNQYGISVFLDDELPYEQLLQDIIDKFKESARFFKNAKMVVSFEGRQLTEEQTFEILNTITNYSGLNIMCVIDKDEEREKYFKQKLEERIEEVASNCGHFYKGNLQTGQVLESETSVIILGSVEAGAKVYSKGSIIIIGSLYGKVYAGITGNQEAFVVALSMEPVQIKIADIISRNPLKPSGLLKFTKKSVVGPKIAFIENGTIIVDSITKDIFNQNTQNEQ
ncbi:septum site-determining protein MinC [Anaerosacchariphilus polymeriproducens]|uniref:Probable septum site-determining protein MinC n=1 Tax=Anaerosacchariphilus polymeriproducens TaxID=1812858 RepID=A0A371AU18_9FIRM|nr:septum site-determining protein MinC [Anaerosacchariphilus polymeriproducens]RDU23061.1 septum site-determining protein MinC [Anaerosacchariphilus polymeriproducens]